MQSDCGMMSAQTMPGLRGIADHHYARVRFADRDTFAGRVQPAHPSLRIRHVSSSLHADLISERFDVAIRLGTLADSRYHAALITHFSILPVATPRWLLDHPVESLEQLAEADWIIHERLASPLHWQVKDARGRQPPWR
jgi:DNA-binding transcriptional LysR family regulator